jgi:hypothetical protein
VPHLLLGRMNGKARDLSRVKEHVLKIVGLAVVLFAALAVRPGIAKEPRVYHGATVGKNAKAVAKAGNAEAGEGANAKGAQHATTPPGDSLDAGVTVLTPRAGNAADKTRNTGVSVKVAKPVNSPVRRVGLSAPVVPNAIGAPVSEQLNAPIGVNHLGATTLMPGTPSAGLPIVRQPVHPIASATIPDRSKIDGGHLIRPTVTSGLGGPAKLVGGINGTAVRPKP